VIHVRLINLDLVQVDLVHGKNVLLLVKHGHQKVLLMAKNSQQLLQLKLKFMPMDQFKLVSQFIQIS